MRPRRASWTRAVVETACCSLASCRGHHITLSGGVVCDRNPNSQTLFCSWLDWVHHHLMRGHLNPGPGRIPATSTHDRFWHSEAVSQHKKKHTTLN